jgi:hypothetical protein
MNLYEVTLHGTESMYVLAPAKYRCPSPKRRTPAK